MRGARNSAPTGCRRLTAPIIGWSGLTGSWAILIVIGILIVLYGLFSYLPLLQTLFATTPLDLATWGRILLFDVTVHGGVEIEKAIIRSNHASSLKKT